MQNAIGTPMSTLFTSSEVRKAAWTLKNNKSLGTDQINVELINCSLEVVYDKKITDKYNNIAVARKYPN